MELRLHIAIISIMTSISALSGKLGVHTGNWVCTPLFVEKVFGIVRTGRGQIMKITIQTDETITDTEIAITCRGITPELEKIVATLRILDRQVTARKGEETFLLDAADIFYIDTADKKTFIYTASEVYDTELRLYELEALLTKVGFLRIGKSVILNLKHIRSLRADLDRRIKVTMENGEQLIVSRQYAQELKKRLGVK